jgi:Tfp pilus assembly protein PilP
VGTHLRLGALLGLSLGLMVGCGGGAADSGPAKGPAKKASRSGPKMEIPQEEAPVEGKRYSYNSIGKRDPFRSFIQREVAVGEIEGTPRGPLQLHEIDQYNLRGIAWNIGTPQAMVEAPDGIGHVVVLGTLIGKNWGKVTQIKPEELVITEEFRDPIENELIVNEITMRLPKIGETKR